MGQKDLAEE